VPATGIRLRHEYAKHAFYDTWTQVYRGLFYNPQSFDAPPKEPLRISLMYLIFLETRIIDLHFPADSLCLSSFNFFLVGAATSRKTFLFLKEAGVSAVQSHSRSVNFVPIENACATSY